MVSALLATSCPVFGQNSPAATEGGDVAITTMPPLPKPERASTNIHTALPAPDQGGDIKLTSTPEPTVSTAAKPEPQTANNNQGLTVTGGDTSQANNPYSTSPAPEPEAAEQTPKDSTTASAEDAEDNGTKAKETNFLPGDNPNRKQNIAALDGNNNEDAATSLAQSPGPVPAHRDATVMMPGRNLGISPLMPHTAGTVQIRKPFKLFASEELIRSMSFRDTPVKEVIAELARRGNLNILIDNSVTHRITGELRDRTLNEAMDSVLAAAGLQTRMVDSTTLIVGTFQALYTLGLNRPTARAFKLSYADPFMVSQILYTSVFNRGLLADVQATTTSTLDTQDLKSLSSVANESVVNQSTAPGSNGGNRNLTGDEKKITTDSGQDTSDVKDELKLISKNGDVRVMRGATRIDVQDGVGYNVASQDPGTQTVRSTKEVTTDYNVDQNGGGTIAIPDIRNRQVIVVGTPEDIQVAEETIRLLDQRPKQVHIQASLVELTNQGIRQLGATLNLQGEGASGNVLGSQGSPLTQYLPGLGSAGIITGPTGSTYADTAILQNTNPANITTLAAPITAQSFARTSTLNYNSSYVQPALTDVTPGTPASAFTGVLGNLLPANLPQISGLTPAATSLSSFNFLTLSKRAGGRANIATLPAALNLSVNLLLQTNKAKIIANPSVIATDNTEVLITLANEVVHKVTSTVSLGVVSTNVELTKAGIFLNVMPRITQDGYVTMRLRPQVSSPLGPPLQFAGGNTVVTLLNIREIISQEVRIRDGQTLVIGGLFTEQEASQLGKVPYLAEAPVVGALFRNTLKGRSRTELMLMITPKIVEEEPSSMTENPNGNKSM
jgi:type II secretory pathway component GspD/PulD (secretin)